MLSVCPNRTQSEGVKMDGKVTGSNPSGQLCDIFWRRKVIYHIEKA
jgi:hypothetical protein